MNAHTAITIDRSAAAATARDYQIGLSDRVTIEATGKQGLVVGTGSRRGEATFRIEIAGSRSPVSVYFGDAYKIERGASDAAQEDTGA